MLAGDLEEDINDIDYSCAGINHMAFYQQFKKVQVRDLYPKRQRLAVDILDNKKISTRTQKKRILVNF